jgi:hypothetical protein
MMYKLKRVGNYLWYDYNKKDYPKNCIFNKKRLDYKFDKLCRVGNIDRVIVTAENRFKFGDFFHIKTGISLKITYK